MDVLNPTYYWTGIQVASCPVCGEMPTLISESPMWAAAQFAGVIFHKIMCCGMQTQIEREPLSAAFTWNRIMEGNVRSKVQTVRDPNQVTRAFSFK